ncbi:putative GTPase [Rhizobium leguminosarum bv. trifolii WSM2012]|nr:putative GTPase [Rhizobium leguminosarum bv. trifolii WSM2012]
MPLTTSSSVSAALASSTVITPSLPTFCIASAIYWPILLAIGGDGADLGNLFRGLAAFANDRLGENGTCGGTVAGDVIGLRSDFADHLGAHVFELVASSSISLATATPSSVMRGAPKDLSITTLRPFGPSVTFTASARISTRFLIWDPRELESRRWSLTGLGSSSAQKTGTVREYDAQGRHTTTARSLHAIPGGGWVTDTPGIRTLHVSDVTDGIDMLFSDITELAPLCRFRDCTHAHEPGCLVQAAVKSGTLAADRLERWRSLLAENRDRTPVISGPRGNKIVRKKKY